MPRITATRAPTDEAIKVLLVEFGRDNPRARSVLESCIDDLVGEWGAGRLPSFTPLGEGGLYEEVERGPDVEVSGNPPWMVHFKGSEEWGSKVTAQAIADAAAAGRFFAKEKARLRELMRAKISARIEGGTAR